MMFPLLRNIASSIVDVARDTALYSADSARVAVARFASKVANNPEQVMSELIDNGINFALKVLAALAIYIIGAWLIKRIIRLLDRIFKRKNTEPAIVSFVKSLLSITLTIILIIITIGTLGINTTSLAAILAAGGMAIGMALSGTVQNFAGGIMLLVFKPFKAGDYIKTQNYEGYVTEVNIFSTKIRTYENSIIILPNGSLANGNIDNFSHNPMHRISWKVNVEYGSDAEFVIATLLEILNNDSRIKESLSYKVPTPKVTLSDMKDSSVEFTARAWAKVEDYWDVFYDINKQIYTILPKKGINFPFPQLDVTIKKEE